MRVKSLQILRFIAAFLVVHTHAANLVRDGGLGHGALTAGRLGWMGATGVDLFFVISGAIMYLTAWEATNQPSAGAFFRRRFFRIAPPYYIVTLAFSAIALTLLHLRIAAGDFLTALTFWPVWGQLRTPVVIIGWSLSFEMLFYAAFALALWRRWLLWAIGAAYVGFWLTRDRLGGPVAQFLGNPLSLEFLAGVVLMRHRNALKAPAWVWGVLLAVGFAALLLLPWPARLYHFESSWYENLALFRAVLFGIPATLIVLSALKLEHCVGGRLAEWGGSLGDASYSLYLTHWVAFMAWTPFLPPLHPDVVVIIALVLAVTLAQAFYLCIERPITRRLNAPRRPRLGLSTSEAWS